MRFCLFFIFLFCSQLDAQEENNNWFLTTGLHLNFNTVITGPGGTPEVTDARVPSYSISSSNFVAVSDENGDLLFYSNGQSIWNANHEPMLNGEKLVSITGGFDIKEAVACCKSCDKYYVFYQVAISGQFGSLRYCEVDMNGDNGLGEVVLASKDTPLGSFAYRAFEVISAPNGTWLVGLFQKDVSTVSFHAYKVNIAGISDPVISDVNIQLLKGLNYDLTSNPNGDVILFIQDGLLFDGLPMTSCFFDKLTGEVDFLQTLVPESAPYPEYNSNIISAAFSPNRKFLYTVERYGFCQQLECFTAFAVFQYSYDTNRNRVIDNTKHELQFYTIEDDPIGQMVLAPTGKLYLSRFSKPFFDVIARPNVRGNASTYQSKRIQLSSGVAPLRMPNQIPPTSTFQFIEGIDLSESYSICRGDTVFMEVPNYYDRVEWSTGSEDNDISFTEAGNYWLQVHDGLCTWRQDFEITDINSSVQVFPTDQVLCNGDYVDIDFSNENWLPTVLWENGSNVPERRLEEEGLYWVEWTEDNCIYRDSINVEYDFIPLSVLPDDTLKCAQDRIRLTASAFNAEYNWNDGSSKPFLQVYEEGLYQVTLTRGICEQVDSIRVTNMADIDLVMESQVELCRGEQLHLTIDGSNLRNFEWSTGETNSSINTKHEGMLIASASDDNCTYRDTIDISRYHCVDAKIYLPNIFNPTLYDDNKSLKLGIPDNITVYSGEIYIYDRYGNMVFFQDDVIEGWNGYIGNRLAQPGAYVVKVKLEVEDRYGLQNLDFVQLVNVFY